MNKSNSLHGFVEAYIAYSTESFQKIWSMIPEDPSNLEVGSVIGALVARQVTLSKELAMAPTCWNSHSAPLFLRAQVDLHITIAWILKSPNERARKFIYHGLGDQKLTLEHYRKIEIDDGVAHSSELIQRTIELRENWINSQRYEFLVEVDLKSWSEFNVRQMAIEIGCEDLYNFAYRPFSQAVHSMWPHISVYNSKVCANPLHRHHLIPAFPDLEIEPDFMYRSCKYVDKTYRALLEAFAVDDAHEVIFPLVWWNQYFSEKDEG